MTTKIIIQSLTTEPWVETSPHDPTTGTVTAVGESTLTSDDTGPWTVSFPSAGTFGVVQSQSRGTSVTQATVTLAEAGSQFTVNVKS